MAETTHGLHLVAEERRVLLALLGAHRIDAATVHVFGSRVPHWPGARAVKRFSDLDLALPGRPDAQTLAALRADLDESDLPWRVDLCLLDDLPIELRALVLQHGQTLGPDAPTPGR